MFDGSVTGRPLREDDPVGPLSAYGRSKRLGEEAVLREPLSPGFHVVRTAWVFGPGGGTSRSPSATARSSSLRPGSARV